MTQDLYRDILGIPPPPEKDHTPYVDRISNLYSWIKNNYKPPHHLTDIIDDWIIYLSFQIIPSDRWGTMFDDLASDAAFSAHTSKQTWRTIARGLLTPEVEKAILKLFPGFDREKHFPHTIIEPAPEKITAKVLPKKKRAHAPLPDETIFQFVARASPSINYLQVFILMSRHTINRHSSRGRKIYPYGQEYVERKLGISRRTVNGIFSWLQRHHIIFKRTNENPDRKKCATWFVCSSWKQSVYFWDPKGRRSKKRSSGSPGK